MGPKISVYTLSCAKITVVFTKNFTIRKKKEVFFFHAVKGEELIQLYTVHFFLNNPMFFELQESLKSISQNLQNR